MNLRTVAEALRQAATYLPESDPAGTRDKVADALVLVSEAIERSPFVCEVCHNRFTKQDRQAVELAERRLVKGRRHYDAYVGELVSNGLSGDSSDRATCPRCCLTALATVDAVVPVQ